MRVSALPDADAGLHRAALDHEYLDAVESGAGTDTELRLARLAAVDRD